MFSRLWVHLNNRKVMPILKKNKKQKITSVSEDEEKLESLFVAGGNVKWYRHYGKQYSCSSKISN